MPKINGKGHYIGNIRVEYEWKPPRCTSCKVFGHIHDECPKNTGASEKKTLKKSSQTSRGVPVGLKSFKPQKEYRLVPKKPTASSSGNKKKGVEPTIEVSNSDPFEVLNSVDNDVELGTNEGTTNLVNNGATSSGSSFMNVDNSSTGTTPITDKIGKFEELLTSGQAILVDEAGNPLKKVEFPGDYDSEDEVASVDNDMARSMASERVCFGTQSLLEQWRDSYGNGDYDDDPYDDDRYEGQDLSQELQAIRDNLDIRVRDFVGKSRRSENLESSEVLAIHAEPNTNVGNLLMHQACSTVSFCLKVIIKASKWKLVFMNRSRTWTMAFVYYDKPVDLFQGEEVSDSFAIGLRGQVYEKLSFVWQYKLERKDNKKLDIVSRRGRIKEVEKVACAKCSTHDLF
ncbi:RNA-directed DNA polymerase, eukaryota, reverse transcriptase zinc-binding domain protein [Tanacetum coccineum]